MLLTPEGKKREVNGLQSITGVIAGKNVMQIGEMQGDKPTVLWAQRTRERASGCGRMSGSYLRKLAAHSCRHALDVTLWQISLDVDKCATATGRRLNHGM